MVRRCLKKIQTVDYPAWVLLAFHVRPILFRCSHDAALDAFDRILIALKKSDYVEAKKYLPALNDVLETFLLGSDWENELLFRYALLHDELCDIRVVVQLGLLNDC